MVVVDGLNERLDFRAFILSFFGHTACDLGRIAFYACNKGVGKWVRFRAGVEGLYDDDLMGSVVSEVLVAAPIVVRIVGFCGRVELKQLPFYQRISLA